MSKSNVVRVGLLSSAAAIALLGAATSAQAVETKFGDVQITLDTTVSMGASMRTASRNTQFLSEGNGGPVDPRANGVIALTQSAVPDFTPFPFTGRFLQTGNKDNYDGSVNADDARLNFDSGELIGGNVKANHDLLVKWANYTFFARAVGFYDVVLDDKNAGDRSQLTDKGLGAVGRNYQLLDAFVSADYTLADMPVNLTQHVGGIFH